MERARQPTNPRCAALHPQNPACSRASTRSLARRVRRGARRHVAVHEQPHSGQCGQILEHERETRTALRHRVDARHADRHAVARAAAERALERPASERVREHARGSERTALHVGGCGQPGRAGSPSNASSTRKFRRCSLELHAGSPQRARRAGALGTLPALGAQVTSRAPGRAIASDVAGSARRATRRRDRTDLARCAALRPQGGWAPIASARRSDARCPRRPRRRASGALDGDSCAPERRRVRAAPARRARAATRRGVREQQRPNFLVELAFDGEPARPGCPQPPT